jgi:hypothetical protein
MSAAEKIAAVVKANLLSPGLTIVPDRGASEDEIREEEAKLGTTLRQDHLEILRRWNGIALEVIRLFGCGTAARTIGRLSDFQLKTVPKLVNGVVIGSDASGFVYVQKRDGQLISYDTDGGEVEYLAESIDDFFERLVFGPEAASFAGAEWLQELRDSGIVA